MDAFTINIAGTAAEIRSRFGSTREYFRQYLTDETPELILEASDADLTNEQRLLDEEADREGLRRRAFTPPFLERAVFQRKLALALLPRGILLLHGSTIAVDGKACLFTAKTGTGKSTHTRFWRELFGDRTVTVNDDRAFLILGGTEVIACGSPWSGKHGLHANIRVPLSGICILERGSENRIAPLNPEEALPLLLREMFLPEDGCAAALAEMTEQLTSRVPLWRMACTKDISAARMAAEVMLGME